MIKDDDDVPFEGKPIHIRCILSRYIPRFKLRYGKYKNIYSKKVKNKNFITL